MWYFTIIKPGIKVNLKAYFLSLKDLLIHMFTQKRFLGCEPTRENKMRWLLHLILVIGYLSLLFTTVFLNWFSTTSNFIVWLGYIESAAIFLITILFMQKRMRKVDAMHKHSQPSDGFFVIWLFLMGFTAFMVRLLIDTQQIDSFFWVYVIHITVLAQWALIIVPFGKWTHFYIGPLQCILMHLLWPRRKNSVTMNEKGRQRPAFYYTSLSKKVL